MNRLEKDKQKLRDLILEMSETVAKNINTAIDGYLRVDEIKEINDDIVDNLEKNIEEICISILIRERLFASDLKQVTGILKLVADIERIGDHAEDIVTFSKKLNKVPVDHINKIDKLAHFVTNMFQKSIKSYLNNDINLAKEVILEDDFVDNSYEEILQEIADNRQNLTEEYIPFMIYTVLVVKYLERIGDHAVNICEWVIYIITGFHKKEKIY